MIGVRESVTAQLEEAVTAYREALSEEWNSGLKASIQENLNHVIATLNQKAKA
jgi:hypothetical protein